MKVFVEILTISKNIPVYPGCHLKGEKVVARYPLEYAQIPP